MSTQAHSDSGSSTFSSSHIAIFAALAAPFSTDEVRTRNQAGRDLQYITARTAMNRLDEVLGGPNWWDEYLPMENAVICKLTVRLPDGSTVTKSDAGGFTATADTSDYEKTGFSDAFKRACVKFGIARYLYGDGVPPSIREELIQQRREQRERRGDDAPPPAGREPGCDDEGPTDRGRHASHDALQPNQGPRGGGQNGNGGPPKSGKALFAWIKERDEKFGVELLRTISDWGKDRGYPARMVQWEGEQVDHAHSEAQRLLATLPAEGPASRIAERANGQPPARPRR